MNINTGFQPHFGKTTIITGPSENGVNQYMRQEDAKANGAIIAAPAMPYGEVYRGRMLTGRDIYRFFSLMGIPFKGSRDKVVHDRNITEAFRRIPLPDKANGAIIGYALTQEAAMKAKYVNLQA